MTDCDVLVIGAGPAGASAARELALGGARVAWIDRAAPPRHKTCGGGVVRRAAELAPASARSAFEIVSARAELHLWSAERESCFAVEEPELVSLAMRPALDHALVLAAIAAGAQLTAPCELLALENGRDRVRARTAQGEITAALAIAADGATGPSARLAGWPKPLACVPALEWEVRAPAEVHERFAHAARFDLGAVPRGYAWVFPKARHLSVGALSMRRGAKELALGLARWLARIGLEPFEAVERHGYVIPVRPRSGGPARGRMLLAGDAAGLVDPLTAEGISHALASGALAARSALATRFDPRGARRHYERSLAWIHRELFWARWAARVLYARTPPRRHFERHGERLVRALAAVVGGRKNYAEMFRDPRHWLKLVLPPALRERSPALGLTDLP